MFALALHYYCNNYINETKRLQIKFCQLEGEVSLSAHGNTHRALNFNSIWKHAFNADATVFLNSIKELICFQVEPSGVQAEHL